MIPIANCITCGLLLRVVWQTTEELEQLTPGTAVGECPSCASRLEYVGQLTIELPLRPTKPLGIGHVLQDGHDSATCPQCAVLAPRFSDVPRRGACQRECASLPNGEHAANCINRLPVARLVL